MALVQVKFVQHVMINGARSGEVDRREGMKWGVRASRAVGCAS